MREGELRRREEQAQELERDQASREETLRVREGKVAQDEATYAERLDKANAELAEKAKKTKEEADDKVKLIRSDLSKDYSDKLKKQEDRFKQKRNELQLRIGELEKEVSLLASKLESAQGTQARAEERATELEKDLGELQG